MEEKNGHNDGFHVLGRASVGDFVGGHLAKALGDGAKHDHGELNPDRERRHLFARRRCSLPTARAGPVDVQLRDCTSNARNPRERKSKGDACDAAGHDLKTLQCWIDDI